MIRFKVALSMLGVYVLIIFSANVYAQENPWRNANRNYTIGERSGIVEKYRSVELNLPSMISALSGAVSEELPQAMANGPVISIPMPDGTFARFRVALSSLLPKALSDQYPFIRAFTARGIDDPFAVAKFDYTQWGFHAMIMSPDRWVFIDPANLGNTKEYISYYRKDSHPAQAFYCETMNRVYEQGISTPAPEVFLRSSGATLRTYRLAVACTGEYAATYGGTVSGALSGIVTSVNRVNGVYEQELTVRLVLIANNNLIVYTNAATDPYTNGSGSTMLGENQTNLTSVIGSANYDIGHVFSTGGGGIASLNSVCSSSNKARGVTGSSSPIGDNFDIDYVAHEMGHQFGGNHTFNSVTGSCNGNRAGSAAYEPGSGTTIMAYAGICGADDIQPHSDAIFHTKSFDEIQNNITTGTGSTCPVATSTGNTPPVVTVGANYTIPLSTPFILTGSATDVNNDPLTYLWEQYDTGPSGAPNSPSGTAPLFRDWVPVIENYRVFPRMEDLVRNQQTLGEILPSYARSMNFRLTVRDNVPGGAGLTNNNTLVTLTVANTTTPFRVTQPNTALNWFANATQTVTWDVSSTDIAPINCTQVNILLSIDSGYTYPYTLLANTPNDGTASVTLPNVISNKARIKVESVGNIFFDISNVNFTISSASPILTLITTSPLTSNSLCAGSNVSVDYSVDGPANAGNVFTAQLSNASGSFASPVNIGSLSATGAGVIAATIPGGTVPGTGYRIRVVSSNPAVIGSDNGTNITLSQPAGTPGGITGSVLVCQGQAGVNYSISPVVNATSYQWTLPSGASITSGNNTNTITVSFSAGATSGNVIVQGSNAGCGNGPASSPLAVTVNTLPATAGAVTGSATICQGQQGVSYSTSVIPGASGYAWTLPAGATIATGANTNSITVDFATNAASGSISVAGTNTCGAGASSSFSLSALPVPTSAVIMAGGPVSFCTGGDVELSYTQDINTVYQWRKNGLEILGETGATYTASTSGDYDVVAAAPQEYNDGTLYSIPDNSCTGASSTIAVSGYSGAVPSAGISVRVNITHTWVGDLVLMLEDPNGGILGLSNRTGNTSNSGDNFTNTVFSDAGAAVLPTTGAPYTGIYKPVSTTFTSCLTTTLTTFGAIGGGTINPNGNWILRVYDRAGADVGTINNWSISFPASLYGPCFSVSNAVTVTVSSPVTAGISITANPGNTICSGASVTFTATPVNGGGSPSYQWKNGLANAGANSSVYTTATLGNGDVIRCVLTSDAVCVTNNPVTSNAITMTVNPTPSVVSFAPTTGSPGATVTINGSGFTGATAVSFNGTPASFVVTNDNQVSATVPGGATTGQISVTSPCGTSFSASNFMVLTGGLVTLNIKLFLEGFYQPGAGGGGMMNDNFGGGGLLYFLGYSPNASDVDTVFISAMDANTFAEVNRKPAILHLDGSASVTFDPVVNGGVAYYIRVNHRNSIETWSAGPVFLMSTYDFTTAPAKAYGNNMVQTYDSQGWAFYSGDISEAGLGQAGVQDGVIESQDYGDMENAVANLLVGYVYSDLTGDGVTESSDYSLMDNNVTTVIVSMHP